MLSRLFTAVHNEPSGAKANPVPLRTPVADGAGIEGLTVGVVVGVDLIAFGDIERVTGERQAVRLVETVEHGALVGQHLHNLAGARHRDQQPAVGREGGHPGPGYAGDDLQRPAGRDLGLPGPVERGLREIVGHAHGDCRGAG